MNRYARGPAFGGASKASASTTCQKCLKKGHYSYECKAVAQERPYVSRPSRTQQMMNPKLMPKLTNDIPQDLLRKKGIADEQLARAELERGRKRDRQSEEPSVAGLAKRRRSVSTTSSRSISTISTNMSRSPSPHRSYTAKRKVTRSPSPNDRAAPSQRHKDVSRSPTPTRTASEREKKRRRDSYSSTGSYVSDNRYENRRPSRERGSSRSTRRRYQQVSPPLRGRTTESRSPRRGRGGRLNELEEPGPGRTVGKPPPRNDFKNEQAPARQRSLSPFSKRLALTQSMNMGR